MLENKFVIAVVSWLGGILATVLVWQIQNRRSVLSYFVNHSKVGTSADDRTFGTVQITWNGAEVPNLYLSTVELRNESSKDLRDIRIKAYSNDTTLLSEFPHLIGTTQFIKYSPEYEEKIAVSPGTVPTQFQRDMHGQSREYVIPTLNRGQVIRFQYINISKSEQQPTIWLEVVHPGVLLRFRPPQNQIFGVPQPLAALAGILLGILFTTLLYAYSSYISLESHLIVAFGSLFFGFIAQIPGAYAIRAFRRLRVWVQG